MVAPTITLVSVSANALQFSFNNPDGAGKNFLVEANRAADFASDDSIYIRLDNAAAGSSNGFSIGGLPSGTPFHVRLKSLTTGQYSDVTLAATNAVAAISSYAGFSIDSALLVVPQDIVALTPVAGSLSPGFPLNNLTRDDPSSTAQYTSTFGTFAFTTSGMPVDTIALLGTSMNDDAIWNIQAYSDAARTNLVFQTGNLAFRCSPTIGRRGSYHALARFAPQTARYWSIAFSAPGAWLIVLRNLVVGSARISRNADKGAGYGVNDLGSATRTRFGVLDSVRGWRGKVVDFAMSWISETEFQAKWADLPGLVGTTKAVLAIPNSKRNIHLNDRIAFGNITQMRGENVQSFKYSQTIEINSIY